MTGSTPLRAAYSGLLVVALATMASSFWPVLPLALAGALAVAAAARGPRLDAPTLATAALVALFVVNAAVFVPSERLFSQGWWRWHGRALIAPLALLALLATPLAPRRGTLRAGLVAMLVLLGVMAVWGRVALALDAVPPPDTGIRPAPKVNFIQTIAFRHWFTGAFRHHEVAGGAYAIATLYATACFLARRSVGWALLFAGAFLGLMIALARAYWGGFLAGALVVAAIATWRARGDDRRRVLASLGILVLVAAPLVATTPGLLTRLSLVEAPAEPVAADPAAGVPEADAARERDARGLTLLREARLFEPDLSVPPPDEPSARVERVVERLKRSPVENRTWWDRLVLWTAAWQGFRARPLTGFGLGMFPVHYRGQQIMWNQTEPEHHAHNNLLQVLVDAGLIGVAVVLAWVVILCRGLWTRVAAGGDDAPLALGCLGGVACLLAGGLLDTNLYAPTLMLPVVVPAALLVARSRRADTLRAPPEGWTPVPGTRRDLP